MVDPQFQDECHLIQLLLSGKMNLVDEVMMASKGGIGRYAN
jgi:hypothetical protein